MDCELVRAGFPGQPVNTITAVAFVIAGALLMARRGTGPAIYGVSLAAIGITSFLLHGIGLDGSIESVAVMALTLWVATWIARGATRSAFWMWIGVTLLLGMLALLVPDARHVVTAAVAAMAAVLLVRLRNPNVYLGLALAGVAVGVYLLTRTGGPWCDPASLLQGHGFWHLLMAVALWVIGDALATKEQRFLPQGTK